MLTCKEASRLISEGLERNLSLRERMSLRLHLWMCKNCRRFEQQMGYLRRTLRRGWVHGDLPANKALPDQTRERIRQNIRERTSNSD